MAQPPGRGTSGQTLKGHLASGTTKSAQLGAKSRADDKSNQQREQKMLKFPTNILILDPQAKILVGRNHLNIIHSRCGENFDGTSNFKEHVSICQGPHTNGDNSFLKRSPRIEVAQSIYPTAVALARPTQLPCPGFSVKELLGRDYESLLHREQKRVDRAVKVAHLVWLDPRSRSSIISTSCLKESPPHQETAKSCCHCSRISELLDFKDILRPEKYQPNVTRYSPFKSIDVKTIDAGQKNTNDKY